MQASPVSNLGKAVMHLNFHIKLFQIEQMKTLLGISNKPRLFPNSEQITVDVLHNNHCISFSRWIYVMHVYLLEVKHKAYI